MSLDNLKKESAKSFIWDFFGKISNHGLSLLVSVFLARILEPADFGLVAMVMVIIGVSGVFSDVGFGAALIQRRKLRPVHYSSVFYFNITIGCLLTVLTFFSADIISGFYKTPELIPLTQALSLLFVINAFSTVQGVKLRRELKFHLLAKIGFLSSFMSGIVGISFAIYGAGVWALIISPLVQAVIYNVFIWSLRNWKPKLEFSLKALAQLWSFGLGMFLSALLESLFSRLDYLIIGKQFKPDTLGYFQRAKTLDYMVIFYSSNSLVSILNPALSRIQNDIDRLKGIIVKLFGVICFFVFLLLGIMYLVSEELILILFTEKWLPSVVYFKLLALSGFMFPVCSLLGIVLSSRGKSKQFLRLEIYKKLLLSLNLITVFMWGIEGYLYGLILVSFIATYLTIKFVAKELSLRVMLFIKPIAVQMVIAIVLVIILLEITDFFEVNKILLLVLKTAGFSSLYIFSSRFFLTGPYQCFNEQFQPIYKQLLSKLRGII